MFSRRIFISWIIVFSSMTMVTATATAQEGAAKKPVFSKSTFDLGIVVSDLDKAAKFYVDVVGMTEVKGFAAPANVATAFGLTDNQPVVVRRFVMDDVKDAPSLKLMAFPDAPGVKPDQRFIHSTLGFSYLTLFVNDMDAVVERAKKAEVKLLGQTPAKAGGNNYLAVYQDPDGNFIELIGPSARNAGPIQNDAKMDFFESARRGNVVALRQHLKDGQDIDAKQNGNVHALGLAALFGHVEAVEFLIQNGAKVNQQTKDGGTALHGASFLGR
ncbi:MAG: VOC family protein, partial [Planctomycetota bacterium]|nr:VOC family protein [Planctomycetota bacterium]